MCYVQIQKQRYDMFHNCSWQKEGIINQIIVPFSAVAWSTDFPSLSLRTAELGDSKTLETKLK